MELLLNGLDVDCVIGERPDERGRLQRLRVDAVLEIPATAGETDALADTVDYAALAREIRETLVAAECQMIERAARLAVDCCFEQPFVRVAEVTVTKTGAIAHLASASARCRLTRAEYGAGRRN
jgi:dihydroneopterin aldolase